MKHGKLWLMALGLGLLMVLVCAPPACASADVAINEANFPDPVFREWVSKFDVGTSVYSEELDDWVIYLGQPDGLLNPAEVFMVERIDISEMNVHSLEGIQYFFSVEYINCENKALTSLNISGLTALKNVRCAQNQLTSLNASNCSALTSLDCGNNRLTSLNVSNCSALTSLDCGNNQLTSLNVNDCSALTSLDCSGNLLTGLNVNSCSALTNLYCARNQLTSLNLSDCSVLGLLDCAFNNLTSLNLNGFLALFYLDCGNNRLTSLDIYDCTALASVNCSFNQLTSLDISSRSVLNSLSCNFNQLTSLDVSDCTALVDVSCASNRLTALNAGGCSDLNMLYCSDNQLVSLNVSGCSTLTSLTCDNNLLTGLDVSGCSALTSMTCDNNLLTSLDVSGCSVLEYLYCYENRLTSLDLSNNDMVSGAFAAQYPQYTVSCLSSDEGYSVSLFELPFINRGNINRYSAEGQSGEYGEYDTNRFYGVMDYEQGIVTFTEKPDYLVLSYDTGSPNYIWMEDILIPVEIIEDAPLAISLYDTYEGFTYDPSEIDEFYCALGSFSWIKYSNPGMTEYSRAELRVELDPPDGTGVNGASLCVTLPSGFSFEEYGVEAVRDFPISELDEDASGKYTLMRPVYPLYSEGYGGGEQAEFKAVLLSGAGAELLSETRKYDVTGTESAGEVWYEPFEGLSRLSETQRFTVGLNPASDFAAPTTAYSNTLGKLGITLSAAAYSPDAVWESYKNLGFMDLRYYNSGSPHEVEFTLARKRIVAGGAVRDVVAVAVRGTVGNEWIGNFYVNTLKGLPEHEGFLNAANTLYPRIEEYCNSLGLPPGSTYGYVCGHSRGGAVANIIAQRLNGDSIMADIYAYTFATPSTTKTPSADPNIFNIVYFNDIVGYVPAGYGKHGVTLVVGSGGMTEAVKAAALRYAGYAYPEPNSDLLMTLIYHSGMTNHVAAFGAPLISALVNIIGTHEGDIGFAHFPENYICWLTTSGVNDAISFDSARATFENKTLTKLGGVLEETLNQLLFLVKPQWSVLKPLVPEEVFTVFYLMKFSCPVNVQITDEAGNIVARTIDHQIDYFDIERALLATEGDSDYFLLPGGRNYSLVIDGTAKGSMDVAMYKVSADEMLLGTATYTGVPVKGGGVGTISLLAKEDVSLADIALVQDGQAVLPNELGDAIRLPASVRSIANEAYADCAALSGVMYIPTGAQAIGEGAFRNCAGLSAAVVPSTVTSIGEGAFEGCPGITIYCASGSRAQEYAIENEINYALTSACSPEPEVSPDAT